MATIAAAPALAPTRVPSTDPKQNEEKGTKTYNYPGRSQIDLGEVRSGFGFLAQERRIRPLLVICVTVLIVASVINALNILPYGSSEMVDRFFRTLYEIREAVIKVHPNEFFLLFSAMLVGLSAFVFLIAYYLLTRPRKVYLLDFSVYTPPDKNKVPHDLFVNRSKTAGCFTQESVEFQEKLIWKTGLGNDTYFPDGILSEPPRCTMDNARLEAEMVMFGALDDLFAKTNIKPKDVDILIVNCSLFNPTPSLSAMIINHYKMRSNIKAFNLSGMGCSAGLISIDLAKDLLQVHKNSNAVVLSTENITQNWYRGNEKAMLVSNTLFRMGGAAIMLTNRSVARKAKYLLHTTVRVHKGASDQAYNSVFQIEDPTGAVGVKLAHGKELMSVVGDALKSNMTTLGPLVLPLSEQLKFVINTVQRKLFKRKIDPYIPDFKKAFQHFCIHAGGRAIIDGLEQNLKLEPRHVEPSRATLYRYGNTSSSSIWYELAFIERKGNLKYGERIWQIAIGSGFKCNSAVWTCINPPTAKNCS